ncbi:hypothetical protein [Corynebacterium sp.]|uniref:hypothetical protein n=1 Tax=Corynebacterium sp. TaxID=1720 RepID=UPI0037C01DBC
MAELKSTISEQLRKFWRANEKELTDSPRRGVASPAEATALREEVAAEIADLIKAQMPPLPCPLARASNRAASSKMTGARVLLRSAPGRSSSSTAPAIPKAYGSS